MSNQQKLYLVWIELKKKIYATSKEKAEEFYRDNLDLSQAKIESEVIKNE